MAHPKEFAEGLSIGIIMDGNGRWAKNRGLPRTAGHKRGAEVFSDIADYCDELGVSSVYFYAFSTENWKRPLEEVNAIMRLFGEYLLKGFDYKNRNIRIKFMGDRTVLDEKLQQLMGKLLQLTFFIQPLYQLLIHDPRIYHKRVAGQQIAKLLHTVYIHTCMFKIIWFFCIFTCA